MRPLGSPAELERRRWRAIDLLKGGLSVSGVAQRLGCSHSSVILWRDAVRRKGESALKAKPAPGRPAKLSPARLKRLPALLLRGALPWGYSTDLWTTDRIAKVIERKFKVRFHRAHVGRLLADIVTARQEARFSDWRRA